MLRREPGSAINHRGARGSLLLMVPTHAPNGGGRRRWGATLAKKTPPGFAPSGAFVSTGIGALTPGSSPEPPGVGNDYDTNTITSVAASGDTRSYARRCLSVSR
jgi:hypothetical protein